MLMLQPKIRTDTHYSYNFQFKISRNMFSTQPILAKLT